MQNNDGMWSYSDTIQLHIKHSKAIFHHSVPFCHESLDQIHIYQRQQMKLLVHNSEWKQEPVTITWDNFQYDDVISFNQYGLTHFFFLVNHSYFSNIQVLTETKNKDQLIEQPNDNVYNGMLVHSGAWAKYIDWKRVSFESNWSFNKDLK